jgi:acetate kinase
VPPPRLLTVNAGSSSLKFAVFEAAAPPRRVLTGAVESVGRPDATLTVSGDQAAAERRPAAAHDHATALPAVIEAVDARVGFTTVRAVGHRIVHGGPRYAAPARVTPPMLAELRRMAPFDPEHLPAEIGLIEAFAKQDPDRPQVACFDTAFHHALPPVARLLPIPRRYAERGVVRYGFHGLSYAYLMKALARLRGPATASGRVVLAHLGNGASLAAVRGGAPVDTTMAFTPASGIPMSTRAGDLDPGLVAYLAHTEGLTADGFHQMVNARSGLLGLSDTSGDVRDLLAREAVDTRAAEALAVFCYQVKKAIGAFAAALGGLDALVFAGGIGEHAPAVRARVCEGLGFLGVGLDSARNEAGASDIGDPASRVAVCVIPTDEEAEIAEAVCRLLALVPGSREGGTD